jgi:hypothetical protein
MASHAIALGVVVVTNNEEDFHTDIPGCPSKTGSRVSDKEGGECAISSGRRPEDPGDPG